MPKHKGYRKRRRTTKYKRYHQPSQPKAGIADRQLVKMKYGDIVNFGPVLAGLTETQIYSANSVFDPDRSGGGAQPRSYDQWAQFYQHYYCSQ